VNKASITALFFQNNAVFHRNVKQQSFFRQRQSTRGSNGNQRYGINQGAAPFTPPPTAGTNGRCSPLNAPPACSAAAAG